MLKNVCLALVAKRKELLRQVHEQSSILDCLSVAMDNISVDERICGSEVWASLQQVQRKRTDCIQAIKRSQQAVTKLLRLGEQNTFCIAVIGKSCQGKSQFVQSLTGLSERQIPTGVRKGGTGTLCVLVNTTGREYAEITYLSEKEMVDTCILPAYRDMLDVKEYEEDNIRKSLDDFLVDSLDSDQWKLNKLRKALSSQDIRSLIGKTKEEIPLDSLHSYLCKDAGRCMVIKSIELHIHFSTKLPLGMRVYDMPGLEELLPGVRKRVLAQISDEADLILLVHRPEHIETGFPFEVEHLGLPVDADTEPRDRMTLVLNLDRRTEKCNIDAVQELVGEAPENFCTIVCDCSNGEDVMQALEEHEQALIDRAAKHLERRSLEISQEFVACERQVRDLVRQIQSLCCGMISTKREIASFSEEFLAGIRGALVQTESSRWSLLKEKLKHEIQHGFEETAKIIDKAYEERRGKKSIPFPEQFPIMSRQQIEVELKLAHNLTAGLANVSRNQMQVLIQLVSSQLSKSCDNLRNIYLECASKRLLGAHPSLIQLTKTLSSKDATGEMKLRTLLKCLEIRRGNSYSMLIDALHHLLGFEVPFETLLLPAILTLRTLNLLDTELPRNTAIDQINRKLSPSMSFEKNASEVFQWLKKVTTKVFTESMELNTMIENILELVMRMVMANYRLFVQQIIWNKSSEAQWVRFAKTERHLLLWKSLEPQVKKTGLGKALCGHIGDMEKALDGTMPIKHKTTNKKVAGTKGRKTSVTAKAEAKNKKAQVSLPVIR